MVDALGSPTACWEDWSLTCTVEECSNDTPGKGRRKSEEAANPGVTSTVVMFAIDPASKEQRSSAGASTLEVVNHSILRALPEAGFTRSLSPSARLWWKSFDCNYCSWWDQILPETGQQGGGVRNPLISSPVLVLALVVLRRAGGS
jgi:hypothetical protein